VAVYDTVHFGERRMRKLSDLLNSASKNMGLSPEVVYVVEDTSTRSHPLREWIKNTFKNK
jgi:hypothetical protein